MTLVGKDTYELTRAIISLIESGISIGAELLFPGVGDREQWEKARKRGTLNTAIKRLEKRNLVSWSESKGVLRLELTERGNKKVLKYRLEELTIEKPKVWDGLFRVIIFDIPENRKGVRESFRKKLKELEFYQLQKSVFVSQYECRDEIEFLKNYYEIPSYVSYILAKEIPDIVIDSSRIK